MPLLLLAILRERITIAGIAMPVALLWLTNDPAAVMGCYTLALLGALRVTWVYASTRRIATALARCRTHRSGNRARHGCGRRRCCRLSSSSTGCRFA